MITVISAWLSRSTRSVFASDRNTSIHLLILPIFVVVVLVLLAHIVRGITYDNRNLSLALALHTFCVCFAEAGQAGLLSPYPTCQQSKCLQRVGTGRSARNRHARC